MQLKSYSLEKNAKGQLQCRHASEQKHASNILANVLFQGRLLAHATSLHVPISSAQSHAQLHSWLVQPAAVFLAPSTPLWCCSWRVVLFIVCHSSWCLQLSPHTPFHSLATGFNVSSFPLPIVWYFVVSHCFTSYLPFSMSDSSKYGNYPARMGIAKQTSL